ncbi:gliding motility-associated C-terminal domain-containing protein [Flavivirga amylovorans]|uniref:Gliding motility-associated C-terminal domain-containing protein n=1 Tax=Flavivirga amylovorans TaxID=870486 RepID=A0ABT8WY59_9FLAO|nr:gliding motility-associated C-terminal domain-containing protein [Flavivirga amylovorans]MDO5986437.1 gliding motility-associated C-terminal domain-containing protein [Flavivirga amylovorans]
MNIKVQIKPLPILVMLLLILQTQAQTINTGEVVILPNTQVSIVNDFNNTTSGNMLNDGELFIYANFNNDGTIDFINEGLTSFQGNEVQQITGIQDSFFYNVIFSNTSTAVPFQLSGSINIDNESEFDEGIVDTSNFGGTFTFLRDADHVATSDNSYIDGEVVKVGDTSFEFPVGNGGFYNPVAMNAPNLPTDTYTAQYFLENSNATNPHNLAAGIIEQIDDTEYWVIDRTSGSSDAIITLRWDADTSPAFINNADPDAIHIVRWDDTLGFWVDEGGIPDAANQTITTIAPVTGYGVFTLATVKTDLVLPDDLVIYTAVSPNSNSKNDFFFIDGIDRYPNNTVKIFNRWGVEVYKTTGYNETDNVFRGYSDGRLTVSNSELLPTGTYYYVLEYDFPGNTSIPAQRVKKAGFLYIASN